LRIGVYAGSPTSLVRDAKGNAAGIAVELGKALAKRLGTGAELVEFDRVAQVVDALAAGKIDVSFMNATPARARLIDFTATLLDIEQGYLVPRGSAIRTIADCDAPGRRVGVTEGSSSQAVLSQSLRAATLVTAASIEAATALVASGRVDAYATNKSILYQMAGQLPGARVLPGAIGLEHMAVAIPKGRGAALSYVKAWTAEAPTQRLVVRAARRAGLRGMVSPQP
jgi:polar amino acid transport system substrate-binding protein